MRPFSYDRATSADLALKSFSATTPGSGSNGRPPAEYLAGGTTLLDLMKLDVMQPTRVVDVGGLGAGFRAIESNERGLRLGALVSMAAAADHPEIIKSYPVLAQSLTLAASAQLRNMASLGGNILQRTRCNYFRDTAWAACNKRNPGSGCAALDGINRQHAVLGASANCIALYPGDFAQALIALDATLSVTGSSGTRSIPFATLHRQPGDHATHRDRHLHLGT